MWPTRLVDAAALDAAHRDHQRRRKKGAPLTQAVPFDRDDLGQAELDEIADVFAGPILTTGEKVTQFERMFADYLGRRHALGVTSCTGALHMSLLALDIGPGDEVITTPMTFIATATAIFRRGQNLSSLMLRRIPAISTRALSNWRSRRARGRSCPYISMV